MALITRPIAQPPRKIRPLHTSLLDENWYGEHGQKLPVPEEIV